MTVPQENFVGILELTIIQHTLNVLVHTIIYVYIKINKKVQLMKCFFMVHHTEQNVHH